MLTGGLSYTESQIGVALGIRAIIQILVMLVYQPLARHRLIGKGSALRMYKFGMWVWPLVVLAYPCLSLAMKWVVAGKGSDSERVRRWMFEAGQLVFYVVWG